MKKEKDFQKNLIKEIKTILPDSIVLKNDPTYIQGFPDLLILHKDKWAALECKKDSKADKQPNQDFYVDKLEKMSYASFISPENKEEVLNELQQAFKSRRSTRISKSK